MPITIEREDDGIYRLEVRGMFREADLLRAEHVVAGEIDRTGPVKLLVVLDAFAGWDPQARWDEALFYVSHGDRITRIAIVGPEKWRDEALLFAGAGLRKGPVEFFPENATVRARSWLST